MGVPLLAELKRRRVFRALFGYAIVAFAILQVIEPVIHGLQLPDWTLSFVVVAIGVGFPVTLALAWVFDLSASGIERTRPVPGETGLRQSPALFALLAGAVALVGVAVVAWHFGFRPRTPTATPAAPSVAVLPFVNMSPQKDDEYFSDGITEEVINALANVEGVRVVSRTSAFAFKGKNLSVRKIGEELAVATVLEGSVRRQGNDVRIVAQLIVNNMVGLVYYASRDYPRAIEVLRRTLELDPGFSFSREILACAYVGAGRNQEALAEIAQVSDADPDHATFRAWVLWAAGERAAAERLARQLLERPRRDHMMRPGVLAGLHVILGDRDRAFELLDQAYAEKDSTLREVKINPALDPLRGDPRFAKLLKKLNLG